MIAFDNLIECGADEENMCFCSNFFPQRHTGMGMERYIELTSRYKKGGFRVASFVSSNAAGMILKFAAIGVSSVPQ